MSFAERHADIGRDIDDALRQVTERTANHEGRLQLIEKSESSELAFIKEQLGDIKTTLDILLAMAKSDEDAGG